MITEERAKTVKTANHSASFGNITKDSEEQKNEDADAENQGRIKKLENQVMDLAIANWGKDYLN